MTRKYDEIVKHRQVLFFICTVSYLIAIAYGTLSWTDIPWEQLLLGFFVILSSTLIGIRHNAGIFFPAVMVGLLFFGYLIGKNGYEDRITDWKNVAPYINTEKHNVTGTIDRLLYSSERADSYRLIVDTIDNTSTKNDINRQYFDIFSPFSIIIEVPNNRHLLIGKEYSFTGKILPTLEWPIEGFERYAFLHRLFWKMRIDDPIGSVPKNQIPFSLWKRAEEVFFQWFPKKVAGILWGMTLGQTNLLDKSISERFTAAWITHILVVSGSNIALVILVITFSLRYIALERWWRMLVVLGFLVFYSAIVGFEPPVIRASIMGIITYIALEYRSRIQTLPLLLSIACIYVSLDPLALIYDASFGLSFGATYGILLFQWWSVRPSWIQSILKLTFGATLWSLGAMIYHFWVFSLWWVIANILIAPIIWWILIWWCIYLLLSMFDIWILLYWFWIPLYLSIEYVDLVAKYMSQLGQYTISESIRLTLSIIWIFCIVLIGATHVWKHQVRKNHP